MGIVLLDMAVSLDGFTAGLNDEDSGLHNYFFSPSKITAAVIEEGMRTTGAIIMGRRTYNIGAQQDGFVDYPYQVATFILSHDVPANKAKGAESFIFVTNGIESMLTQARAAAGDQDVVIGGGANTAQQFIGAGLLDEIQLHIVPVLLGEGIRLFDDTSGEHIHIERIGVVDAPDVTHIRFRFVK